MKLLAVVLFSLLTTTRAEKLLDGRIVGGQNADIADFPYQISLQIGGLHFCGGSIIGKNWIITAAHCLGTGYKPLKILSVRVGSSNRNTGGNVIKIEQIYTHPDFIPTTLAYDVALIKTKTDIIGDNAIAINLPEPNMPIKAGKQAIVSGWGYLTANVKYKPENLQYININIIDEKKCKNYFMKRNWKNTYANIGKTMICAAADGKDACKADSGGPIVVDGILVGVVSFGIGCAVPDTPGIYTRLANPDIRKWVKDLTLI